MKRFLKKRWHHLPIGIVSAVLVACLIAGSAFAAYQVWQYTFQTTVEEPITVVVTEELTNPMYPGLGTNSEYIITNIGPVGLDVTATWPGSDGGPVKCYATIRYIDAEGHSLDDIVRTDYDGTETFTLHPAGNAPTGKSNIAKVQLAILVFADAPPGDYSLHVEVARG